MINKFSFILIILSVGFLLGFVSWSLADKSKDPDEVIRYLNEAVLTAQKNGDYRCCIEPACTMCYLGHWKFEKGTCFCDDAIKEGRDEDVCPECKKGMEEGRCSSLNGSDDKSNGTVCGI